MNLQQAIKAGKFVLTVEFTPHSKEEVANIAAIGKGLVELNRKYESEGLYFEGISLTQNPGGNVSYDHQAALAILREHGFPDELQIMPHITGKDMNADSVRSLLVSLVDRGVRTILALTGDLSDTSKGVFEVDSLGLLQLVRSINMEILRKANPVEFASAPVLEAGAAVSPFKYTEGSLAMQFIKAQKKVREGATFLTCQCGWDVQRSELLMQELNDLGVPIFGNALVVGKAAGKYMQSLPGCVISDAFLTQLGKEKLADSLKRAGQQVAMFRQMGYAGADLGKPGDFKSIEQIDAVLQAALATKDWKAVKDNLHFPMPESKPPKVSKSDRFSWFVHNNVFEEDGALYPITKALLTPFEKSAQKEGALYHLFNCLEGMGKGLMYQCEHCGDCFLPENKYVCTIGQCEKGLDNPPCGDADPKGICGNNPNRVCVGETLYYRVLHRKDMEEFKRITLPRRDPNLQDTSSLLNYFFGRDHAKNKHPLKGSGIIAIAELLHASIPLPGAAMRFIQEMGPEGFARPNKGLMVVKELISSQARQGADYIDINVDALLSNTQDAMRQYVRLVHRLGEGVPPCIDSSNLDVLVAGLAEWFSFGDVRPPLINSIPYTERMHFAPLLELRKKHAFSIIAMLGGPEGTLKSPDEIYSAGKEMFQLLTGAGFKPEEIFFDTITLGLATDSCMDGMGEVKPTHTRNSFHGIRKIKQDPAMRNVHAVLGVSNWVHGIKKRRIGHVRAFIEVGKRYGLDGAILDVEKRYGVEPAAPELVKLVEAFVSLDGGEDSMMRYSEAMQNARQAGWL